MSSSESKELKKLLAVMGAWYAASEADATTRDAAADFRSLFGSLGDPARALKSWSHIANKKSWSALPGYFSAMSVTTPGRDEQGEQTYWPLIGIQLREQGGAVQMMMRVVLCASDADGSVDGWGWRFDSADADQGANSHPYAHVQHITTWESQSQGFRLPELGAAMGGEDLHPAEVRKTTPETKPAMPLACNDLGGLAVAVMISIYGARRTANILGAVAQADDQFLALCGRSKLDFSD